MKRILYLLLLFFFALSCKEIDETPENGALNVSQDVLTFYSAGGYEDFRECGICPGNRDRRKKR